MKRLLLIIVLLVVAASGCVPLGKHQDLINKKAQTEKELALLQQKYRTLETENARLSEKEKNLAAEISLIKKGAESLFAKGMDLYRLEHYHQAIEQFEKVMYRFPTDPLAAAAEEKITEIKKLSSTNYQKTLKAAEALKDPKAKADFIDKEMGEKFFTALDLDRLLHKKEQYMAEFKLTAGLNQRILVEDDPTQSLRLYRTTRNAVQHIGDEKSFSVEFYIAHHYSGKKDLRIKTRYIGNRWISYDSIVLRGENTQVEVICKYPEKLSNMVNERIYEWSDNDIDDEKLIKLSKSSAVSVRFNGGYKFTFPLDDEQLQGLKEIVKKYQSLK